MAKPHAPHQPRRGSVGDRRPSRADDSKRKNRHMRAAMDKMRVKMPTREDMAESKYLAPIAHRFLSPELWRFTRRSVPRGVALGLFAAFIIPLGQIFLAAFLALPARANVPLAAAVTFVTNPFTVPFWLVAANRVGGVVLAVDVATSGGAAKAHISGQGLGSFGWFLQEAGVTAFGFVVMAVIGAALGYIFASVVWRGIVMRRRRNRLNSRLVDADGFYEEYDENPNDGDHNFQQAAETLEIAAQAAPAGVCGEVGIDSNRGRGAKLDQLGDRELTGEAPTA